MIAQKRMLVLLVSLLMLIGALIALRPSSAGAQPFGYNNLNPVQKRHVSGTLEEALGATLRAHSVTPLRPTVGVPQMPGPDGCPATRGNNVKVNQNCLNLSDSDQQGRGQAQNETWIAADPRNPSHLVASYNDYRRGDGTCGVSYSLDGGKHWADTTVPNEYARGNFVNAPREYWQGSGDTSVQWDSKGNTYLACQMFNRGITDSPNPDESSSIYVFRSTQTDGASFNFPGRPVSVYNDTAGTGNVLIDKPFMTVDNHRTSRYADRIYVSWTSFAADGTAYIYLASSEDYGETFSAPVIVSRDSNSCSNTYGLPTPQGRCNEDQFSQPFTAPDGTLYVTWSNYNTPATGNDNRYQVLLARSTDGGQRFSAPVKVSDYYDLPDCATYQGGADPGTACVPEKGSSMNSIFRAANYPIGAVDPATPNNVIVTFASYINRNSNEQRGCIPAGFSSATGLNLYNGVKHGGCNNDIVYSVSTNRGNSFSGGVIDVRLLPVVSDSSAQSRTDQFWQNAVATSDGKLIVSYYDRAYGNDEWTGYSDITVSHASLGRGFTHQRATSGSMPPPTEFDGLFYGDYAGLDVASGVAYPIWSDTRTVDEFLCPGTRAPTQPPTVCSGAAPNAPFANDQDIYTALIPVS